ncbi:MAG: tRNA (N(6)-L-threonylcarbamoyladenosine(37)-C(2))-methylthiotransferase MtaB [Nannocystaceae bacterium]
MRGEATSTTHPVGRGAPASREEHGAPREAGAALHRAEGPGERGEASSWASLGGAPLEDGSNDAGARSSSPPTIAFSTLGCRLNQFETDAMIDMAERAGYVVVRGDAPAQLHVVNTCAITHEADADSRQQARRAARQGSRVLVTGCYAAAAPREAAALPGVVAVFGNREKERLLEFLGAAPSLIPAVDLGRRRRVARLSPSLDPRRSRALLKVQDGCDYRCSFCVVPSVRGRSASVEPREVARQLDALVAAGAPEIVLTGAHLGTYGRDLRPRVELSQLVARLLPRLGQARLRLGSIDPHEVDDALIELLAARPGRLCRHLHLPVQSGDDAVLRAMRRGHRADELRALTSRLAARVPGIALGTDVIVGFPGEDAAAADRTHALLSAAPIAYAHVFPYSRRAGTPAADAPAQVPARDRERRAAALRQLARVKQRGFVEAQLGARLDVVVYRARDRRTGALVGLTDNYVKVRFAGDDALLGRPARVELCALAEQGATGVLVGADR